jgi:hypothetical protein
MVRLQTGYWLFWIVKNGNGYYLLIAGAVSRGNHRLFQESSGINWLEKEKGRVGALP